MSVLDNQLAEGRLMMRLPRFVQKEKKALSDLRVMIDRHPHTYLSLSWGKQSIILAHMLWQIRASIPAVFFDEPDTDIIADFKDVRDKFLNHWPINYRQINDGQESPRRSGKKFAIENSLNGVIMGLAAHESRSRNYTLNKSDKNNIFEYTAGNYRCCPLAQWTIKDYAAYIAKYNLPLLYTYQKYGLDARTSAGITPGRPSYAGREFLNSTNQAELDNRLKERGK